MSWRSQSQLSLASGGWSAAVFLRNLVSATAGTTLLAPSPHHAGTSGCAGLTHSLAVVHVPFTSAPRDYSAPLPLDLLFLIEVTLCFFYDNGYKDVIKSYNVIMPSERVCESLEICFCSTVGNWKPRNYVSLTMLNTCSLTTSNYLFYS